MAGTVLLYIHDKLRKIKTLTGVGNLSNFVTVEAVPIGKISKCGYEQMDIRMKYQERPARALANCMLVSKCFF